MDNIVNQPDEVTHDRVDLFIENRRADLNKDEAGRGDLLARIDAEVNAATDDPTTRVLIALRVLAMDGKQLDAAGQRHDAYMLAHGFMRVPDEERLAYLLGVDGTLEDEDE